MITQQELYNKLNPPFEERIDKIWAEVRDLLIKKDIDYGSDNLDKFGVVGITIRMGDKMSRLENFMMNKKCLVQEKIEDTLHDLIGYAVHYLLRLEGCDGDKEEEMRTRLLSKQDFRKANYPTPTERRD